jgi:hypothetical protein
MADYPLRKLARMELKPSVARYVSEFVDFIPKEIAPANLDHLSTAYSVQNKHEDHLK